MQKSIIDIVSVEEQQQIVSKYLSGTTIKNISKNTGYTCISIRKILSYNHIPIKSFSDYMWIPSKVDKQDIIQLYSKDIRGIDFISKKYNVSWNTIAKWISKWKLPKHTRRELGKSNANYYGPTSGFLGRKHSNNTRKKMSGSQLNNKNRVSTTGPKSRYIMTVIGNVQGSYEVAYLQQIYERGTILPSIGRAVHTPYGSYIPDFSTDAEYVEIKSKFTWNVCRGLETNQKGIKSDIQYRKIKWVDKYVKPVKVVVMTDSEVIPLFRRAILNKSLVLDEIVYKNGKYAKLENKVSSS